MNDKDPCGEVNLSLLLNLGSLAQVVTGEFDAKHVSNTVVYMEYTEEPSTIDTIGITAYTVGWCEGT